jgi:hypothetical protein
VMKCPHPTRSKWRDSTAQQIQQYCHTESDPRLLDILQDGIIRYHRNLPPINPDQYPATYRTLIMQQNSIGWDHLYRGRWSHEWTTLQDEYARRQGHGPSSTSHSWIVGVGRLLIDQWLILWKLRNEQRHGADQARHSQIRETVLRNELQQLYTYKSQVCPIDSHIFHESEELHWNQSNNLAHIQNWITIHKDAIMASVVMAKRLGIQRNRTLLEYPAFNPIAPARDPPGLAAGGFSD